LRGLLIILTSLLLAGCPSTGDGLTKEQKPCSYITHKGYCICRGASRKEVWAASGDYMEYYEACYNKKHPYAKRFDADEYARKNAEIADEVLGK